LSESQAEATRLREIEAGHQADYAKLANMVHDLTASSLHVRANISSIQKYYAAQVCTVCF
jgi:hypothetical protein